MFKFLRRKTGEAPTPPQDLGTADDYARDTLLSELLAVLAAALVEDDVTEDRARQLRENTDRLVIGVLRAHSDGDAYIDDNTETDSLVRHGALQFRSARNLSLASGSYAERTPAQLAEGRRLVAEWRTRIFEDGTAACNQGDFLTAVLLWRLLADQGFAGAQYNIGQMYYDGRGGLQDYAEAARWWRLAAEQGDANAQFNLGQMYYHGEGVIQDHSEAALWYRRAADQGDAEAQHNLGVMYEGGQGVPRNVVEAYRWYSLASSDNRAVLAKTMTAAQTAEANELIREWVLNVMAQATGEESHV